MKYILQFKKNYSSYIFCIFVYIKSLTGRIVFEALRETHLHLFLSMELISKLWNHQSLIQNGGLINLMDPDYDMRLEFAFALGILFGLTEGERVSSAASLSAVSLPSILE